MFSASSRNKDWETVAEAAAPDVEVMEATGQSAPATGSTDSLIDSGTDVNEALAYPVSIKWQIQPRCQALSTSTP